MQKKAQKKPVSGKVAKVPVIMQLEALECGAAALAMVLAYYDRWIPLEQVRKDCGVSRDGSNAKNMLLAARNYGLSAGGYKCEPKELKEGGSFPCIIHWNFNHFVVLKGFKGGKVYLNDPARGSVTVTEEEFDRAFTGIVILLEPDEGFEAGGTKKSMVEFAQKRLKGAKSAIVFVILTTFIASVTGIINPAFSRIFIDRILSGKDPGWLIPFTVFLSVLCIVQVTVAWINAVYLLRINGKLAVVGKSTFMWKVLYLPLEFFSQRLAGDIQQRQNANTTVAESLVNIFAPACINGMMVILYLFVMLRYSVVLSLVGIITVFTNLAVSNIISKKRINITRVSLRDQGKLDGTTVSGIEMIETIKASGAENGFFEKWSGYQASVNTQNVRYAKLNVYLGMIPELVSSLSSAVILMLGVYLVIKKEFTVGMIMAFQGYLSAFMQPATTVIGAGQEFLEMRSEMERIEDVMEYPTDPLAERAGKNSGEYSKLSGDIEIKDLTFGYSPLAEPLIKDFNLSIKKGSKIAIVGSSGCGKSTIAKLLSGLYRPWSGEILYDNKPITDIDREVFTGSVAVMDQDIVMFKDSISNNIRMWDDSIEDFEVILAANDAQIHEDIMLRSGGYDFVVTEGGKDFSGGQRQRMEIARVLAQDPTIVIMDEATSALDARTEYDVVKSIKDRGVTTIVIAHRLSTIRDCDDIIVMEKGHIAEQGTHEELYAKGGIYTRLISTE